MPEGTRLGNFRIIRRIASGGFAIVYLAQDQRSGEEVAIKEYVPAMLTQRHTGDLIPFVAPENRQYFDIGMARFLEEARTLNTIDHINIVRVKDVLHAHGTAYMVMRFVEGRPLQEHIRQGRDPDRAEVLTENFIRRVFCEVLDGLREVHNHRVLHLDLKPGNIYLQMNGTPIILDFGAARETLERDISKIYPMYTPGFAAPEQYKRDAEVGAWTDVYGVGACIFTCMTGKAVQEAASRLQGDTVPGQLNALRGVYSKELINIAQGCLTLNSLERPQSARALQQLLARGVPKHSKEGLLQGVTARLRQGQAKVAAFLKKHDVTWF